MVHEPDRYGGPKSWDVIQAELDAMYAEAIDGRTCFDCCECVRCDLHGHESVGWCCELEGFVAEDDTPVSTECRRFAA